MSISSIAFTTGTEGPAERQGNLYAILPFTPGAKHILDVSIANGKRRSPYKVTQALILWDKTKASHGIQQERALPSKAENDGGA